MEMTDALADWARRLRASDAAALSEVMGALHAPLLRFAIRLTRDEAAAYDVLQEAFIKLWQVRDSLDPDRSLRSLLCRIVSNLALNHIRMKQREAAARAAIPSLPDLDAPTPGELVDTKLLGERIHQWIADMPPRRQEAFRLSRFDGLSHDEISDVMGLTRNTVTTHIMHALQYLRDRLHAYQTEGLAS